MGSVALNRPRTIMPSNFCFLVIFLVCLTIFGVHSGEVDCKGQNAANCDTSVYIQEIECKQSEPCTCKDENQNDCAADWNPDPDGDGVDITYETLKDYCEAECEENLLCRFYKYVERRGKKHCYAMDQDQCTQQAQDEQCNPDHCQSGYVLHTDEVCEENTDGGGDDGIIVPDVQCPTGSVAKHSASTMPDNYLRWNCIDMHSENVDIYGDGEAIPAGAPAGTRCTTRPGCDGIDYVYKCDLADGIWKPENPSEVPSQDPIDTVKKYLNDVKCNAPDLILNKEAYEQPGLEIQCVEIGAGQVDTTDKAKPTVKSQNNCLLLCDWYPVVNFYTKGTKWMYVDMEDDNLEENEINDPADQTETATIIYCW